MRYTTLRMKKINQCVEPKYNPTSSLTNPILYPSFKKLNINSLNRPTEFGKVHNFTTTI